MAIFTQAQKQKYLSMKVTLMMCFNHSILQLYQIYNPMLNPINVSKKCCEKNHVLIKNLNTFMYGCTLRRGRKHFCHYCF